MTKQQLFHCPGCQTMVLLQTQEGVQNNIRCMNKDCSMYKYAMSLEPKGTKTYNEHVK